MVNMLSTLALLPILLLSTLSLTAAASPTPKRDTSAQYYVKTAVISGLSAHDGLYLEAYHTGAGLNDPVFVNGTTTAAIGTISEGHQEFNLSGSSDVYGFTMSFDDNYADWEPVAINGGEGTAGFSIDLNQGIVWSSGETDNEFGGWIVCDWYHSLPQLFSLVSYYEADIPSSCSRVQLQPQYL